MNVGNTFEDGNKYRVISEWSEGIRFFSLDVKQMHKKEGWLL